MIQNRGWRRWSGRSLALAFLFEQCIVEVRNFILVQNTGPFEPSPGLGVTSQVDALRLVGMIRFFVDRIGIRLVIVDTRPVPIHLIDYLRPERQRRPKERAVGGGLAPVSETATERR